ncbi:hypothetical protein [Chitinophaga arvensicola]|uniref:Fasciclin domain-containing protein n=1 Tax=Chitinophaga arvensicola TaxID=29529 RepID=A0A1I0RBS5_9BACT|nr:hypothetical protein [Chitinophaga arvensicola]SEW38277.1 Fasciclin domain-containing protein [Chitinophaga arvensicola]
MNKLKIFTRAGWGILLLTVLLAACKKDDHFIGGSVANDHTDLTTYDYLKANPDFDTLILLIDKAGLKETINSDVTFAAPTDYSIKLFLASRTKALQAATNNENIKYTIDSLKAPELRDSLLAYVFQGKIVRTDLSMDAQVYKNKVGEDFAFKLVNGGFGGIFAAGVKLMAIVKVIHGLDPVPRPDEFPDEDKDKEYTLQTTGIITKTGVLHVVQNNHVFYWK